MLYFHFVRITSLGNGTIDFEEFATFCAHNLLHLEREKHIRALHNSIHKQATQLFNKDTDVDDKQELADHLLQVFKMADEDGSGHLNHAEIESLFHSLDIRLSDFELNCVMAEADTNHDGLIEYTEFIPVCVELLQLYRLNEEEKLLKKGKLRPYSDSICTVLKPS